MRVTSMLILVLLVSGATAKVFDFDAVGGRAGDGSLATAQHNGALINATLALLRPGDELVFPNKSYHAMGGIVAHGLRDIVIHFEGTIVYDDTMKQWPRSTPGSKGTVLACLHFYDAQNLTLTSSGKALFNGQGKTWWGVPFIGYALHTENRPRLLVIENSRNVLVENLFLQNSPYWTFWAPGVDGLEVRHCDISARRDDADGHSITDITAFNTDGFDVTGRNVWIHDCTVWNQDDTIAVKDGSQDMLFERIEASGVGLTIGSIGGSTVKNITFRDCHMHKPLKGIYMKFRGAGRIEDVTYENITIDRPEESAIWIGPAQQSDSIDLCAAHPCSLCWPMLPTAKCNLPAGGLYKNITLRDIRVLSPKRAHAFVMANSSTPMQGVIFDNVVVTDYEAPKGQNYYQKCTGVVAGVARGSTSPVPPCFADNTSVVTAQLVI